MITIKLKYSSTNEFQNFLFKLRKQYSNVYRYSYNRLYDGYKKMDIYNKIKKLNNIELIKPKLIDDSIDLAKYIYKKDKKINHKSIFGGKQSFINLIKNKITKEEFLQKRLISLYIQGETANKGNRYFNLDIINNRIIYKYDRKNHFVLNIKQSKNQQKQLLELEELCNQNKSKYTITLTEEYICITFDPIKHKVSNLIRNRYIGIDLNPTNIGLSVCELNNKDINTNIIDTYNFDFSEIINNIKRTKELINSKRNIYLNNKLNHEILDISKRISELSRHYKCKFIFIEDLKFKQKNEFKYLNRLNKNLWKRNIFIENLNKRIKINGQSLFKVNPAYTSLIGNCKFNYTDAVNASIEIGRRGFEIIIKKSKKFYPTFWIKQSLKHRWKEMDKELPDNWKGLYTLTKNLKLSYRVSLEDANAFSVFRKKPRMYNIYQFQ